MVGGDYVPRNLACLAEDGRHVSIAVQRGATAEIPIVDIMRRRLTLTGSTLRPRSVEFKTMVADEIAKTVWPYVEGGRLKPVIDSVFPLAEAAEAHARMEAGEHVGKIVLEVGGMNETADPPRICGVGQLLQGPADRGACVGVPLERREYDIMKGETRTPEFLAEVNANGRIPVLQVGDRFIPESNAACYLPRRRLAR